MVWFPKTEIQVYGYTAVVCSNYAYELETGAQPINQAGRSDFHGEAVTDSSRG